MNDVKVKYKVQFRKRIPNSSIYASTEAAFFDLASAEKYIRGIEDKLKIPNIDRFNKQLINNKIYNYSNDDCKLTLMAC